MRKNVKKARLSFDRPFVAAYTDCEDGIDSTYVHPNYALATEPGTDGDAPYTWCVRFGVIEVPWGIGADESGGFKAHGALYVSREMLDGSTFVGRGFEFVKRGEVNYLYESELID